MRYAADTTSPCWIYDSLDHSTLTHLQPQSAKLYLTKKVKEKRISLKLKLSLNSSFMKKKKKILKKY